ncbi:hypothetical protein SUGI_0722480 [Cryptomeria japonica]|uniref:uncharacterized protein LOC131057774 n=1 Tax=Cryptomeria japonica TaxID=3369 RepID=UPI0024147092|nr:uncharacterized protein LOC131057774 [Cryptomeria japonica]GLJ36017.1 hypothetical protein SUGI_0722480 [Cryptomeria japonica]
MDRCQCFPSLCQCFSTRSPGLPLHIPLVWVVRAFMLTSMQLQLFLVVFGARRYRSSSCLLRSVVWGAYLAADAVAISALGIMTHSIRNEIYGLWAPILLIHLGGPDTITAYSTADNELWLRHCFIMIYQVLIAAYVLYLSRLEGYLLAASVLLFIAGATKYAERTYALRFASNSQMVNSTNALYKFMQVEGTHDQVGYNYVVMGEQILSNKEFRNIADSVVWDRLLSENAIITMKKVFEQEGRQRTDKYILCLSHALFKMYKRRLVGLFFHEGLLPKSRSFFINEDLKGEDVFKIIEIELKFMYDVLFSKSGSTAFRKEGIVLRLLNSCLLAVAAYLVFFQLTKKPAHKTVTFVIISVALLVEIIQLCRIALSDWTMVRLICAQIQHLNRPRPGCWLRVLMVQFHINLLSIARKLFGNKYWKDKINQYCMISARGQCFNCIWNTAKFRWMRRSLVVFCSKKVKIEDKLKSFIFEIVRDKCSPEQSIQICRDRVYDHYEYLIRWKSQEMQEVSEMQLEDAILVWHIATSICNAHDGDMDRVNFKVAGWLSKYFAYLLVVHPNVLPLHPDIALLAYIELHGEIFGMPQHVSDWKSTGESIPNQKLSLSIRLAEDLMSKEVNVRWEIIAQHWGELLICVAAYNKAPLHAECIAAGGEFLSQVWALLGHLGCGEQSDTAVTKRKETRQMDQEYIQEKRREENLRKARVEGDNRRIEEMRNRTLEEIENVRSEEHQKRKKEEEKTEKIEEKLKAIMKDP